MSAYTDTTDNRGKMGPKWGFVMWKFNVSDETVPVQVSGWNRKHMGHEAKNYVQMVQ